MRAITEMPANTPRPIGRTDNFFPGSVKAACEEALAAAAEASEAESAADVAAVVEEPLKELDVVLAEEDEEEDVGDGATAGPLDTPLTITAGFALTDGLAVEAAELVAVVLLPTLLLVELVKVVATVEKVAAVDDPVDEPSDEPLPEPLSPLPLSKVNVQSFTSCTSGCPSVVIGVKVIVHISVAGPIGVFVCVTVVTVVG